MPCRISSPGSLCKGCTPLAFLGGALAVFTALDIDDASRITRAHGLGAARDVVPIPAGSVNSNFFVDVEGGRRFLRIYEEQDVDGVRYEWALLEHLRAVGLAVPIRVTGPGPGELRVAGKPTALFELVGGEESCQRGVTVARAAAVGSFLGAAHHAGLGFERRRGRFEASDLERRIATFRDHPALGPVAARLTAELASLSIPHDLPRGIVHGDLFRDNVRFEGDRVVAVIDWESASEGALGYDLMVTVLAWCFGDAFEPALASAMVRAYDAARPLSKEEKGALRRLGMAAAIRFATTRVTDYTLRSGIGARVMKDYRRFVMRLDTLAGMTDTGFEALLF